MVDRWVAPRPRHAWTPGRTSVNLVAVLITGLFAGGISCAAVQGGLLTGLITRQQDAREPAATDATRSESRSWRGQLGDDLAPVSGFLAGKLAAYTLLGGVIRALGGVVQLSPTARNWGRVRASLLIISF